MKKIDEIATAPANADKTIIAQSVNKSVRIAPATPATSKMVGEGRGGG